MRKKTNRLIECILSKLYDAKDILICTCGDVSDKGSPKGYDLAISFLRRIKQHFSKYNLHFEFVPGNHDLCGQKLSYFDNFTKEFSINNSYEFSRNRVAIRNFGEFDLALFNSVFHKDHSYGYVDVNSLQKVLYSSPKRKIAVVHHTLLSRYDDDSSVLRNGHNFSTMLGKANFTALLHGHTHGYSDFRIGDGCQVIGVGPLFKTVPDVNNQFNLIKVIRGNVVEVENFFYRSDTDNFDSKSVFKTSPQRHFEGRTASNLQQEILAEVKESGLISNLSFTIKTEIDAFFRDIETFYSGSIQKAEKWLNPILPPTLHYNHAMFFNCGKKEGMAYIIEELQRKTTSSRALIPLISVADVVVSEDGFLPSLNIVQFGFNDETREEMHVTLYLRALEVKHFLPINLCEVYLLTKQMLHAFRAIKRVVITINAFRAQYKEAFGCHEKAQLDSLSQAKIMMLLMQKDFIKLGDLIREKLQLSETVIIDTGIRNLSMCINEVVAEGNQEFYCSEIVETINALVRECDRLKEFRKSTSVYSEIQKAEKDLINKLRTVESTFNEMGKNT